MDAVHSVVEDKCEVKPVQVEPTTMQSAQFGTVQVEPVQMKPLQIEIQSTNSTNNFSIVKVMIQLRRALRTINDAGN